MAWNQPGNPNKDPWRGKDPNREVQAFVDRQAERARARPDKPRA